MAERKDKREERVEDLQVQDDAARDIAGGRKKARARAAGKKSGKALGGGPIHRRDA